MIGWLWLVWYELENILHTAYARYRKLLCPIHNLCDKTSLWHGDNVQRDTAPIVRDSAWQRVWHGQVSASLLPSDSCFPLLTLTTCNFAKLSEKCSVTVSKYSNVAIFKVQSLWGFPQNPDSTPALLESAACVARGMSQSRGILHSLTAYPLHFTPSQNVSISRVLLQSPRPAHPLTSKLSTISCSRT